MKINSVPILIIAWLVQVAISINPYHVLGLEETVTQEQVRKQYKLLRKQAHNDDIKLQLYRDAFQQIMLDSTLEMTLPNQPKAPKTQNRRNRRRRRGLPRLSDMFRPDYFGNTQRQRKTPSQKAFQMQDEKNYAEQIKHEQKQQGFKLPSYLDDSEPTSSQQRAEQVIRDQNVSFNIKAARMILFIGGIFLKLLPCICLYMIYRFRRQNPRDQGEQNNNPFSKAIDGWTGKNRRTIKKNK